MKITIVVQGIEPASQGSKTVFGAGRFRESSKKLKPWREAVRQEAIIAVSELSGHEPWDCPLRFSADFYWQRPKSHFNAKGDLRPKYACPYKAAAPDGSKVIRSTEDALTGIIWKDDARVAIHETRKLWCTPQFPYPGAIIAVEPLT